MTCVRVLEIIPVVFERLRQSFTKHSGSSGKMVKSGSEFLWLHDLMDWGKSSLKVIIVYWKRTVSSLLNQLKGCISNASGSTIRAIENLISSGELHTYIFTALSQTKSMVLVHHSCL